jgi:hypothetical protein
MESLIGILFFLLGLLYFLYLDYFVWMKPTQYSNDIHERRSQLKLRFPFLPNWVIGFIFFYEQPLLSIWWARIVLLIATIICIMGVIATIHGPF